MCPRLWIFKRPIIQKSDVIFLQIPCLENLNQLWAVKILYGASKSPKWQNSLPKSIDDAKITKGWMSLTCSSDSLYFRVWATFGEQPTKTELSHPISAFNFLSSSINPQRSLLKCHLGHCEQQKTIKPQFQTPNLRIFQTGKISRSFVQITNEPHVDTRFDDFMVGLSFLFEFSKTAKM